MARIGLARAEVFVTTRLWNEDQQPARLQASVARSNEALGLGAPDPLLLHWPVPGRRPAAWAALDALEENLATGWNPQPVE